MESKKLSRFEAFSLRMEDLLMSRLLPKDNPGPLFSRLFRIPILFYRMGLPLFGGFMLLLTTTGRKSGRPRLTPLEYRREGGTGCAIIMAGWGGNTDWRRNILANPHVHVQVGSRQYDAVAESLSDEQVAAWLLEALRANPASSKIWSRWAGETVCLEEPDSALRAAKHFPSFRLRPLLGE